MQRPAAWSFDTRACTKGRRFVGRTAGRVGRSYQLRIGRHDDGRGVGPRILAVAAVSRDGLGCLGGLDSSLTRLGNSSTVGRHGRPTVARNGGGRAVRRRTGRRPQRREVGQVTGAANGVAARRRGGGNAGRGGARRGAVGARAFVDAVSRRKGGNSRARSTSGSACSTLGRSPGARGLGHSKAKISRSEATERRGYMSHSVRKVIRA